MASMPLLDFKKLFLYLLSRSTLTEKSIGVEIMCVLATEASWFETSLSSLQTLNDISNHGLGLAFDFDF